MSSTKPESGKDPVKELAPKSAGQQAHDDHDVSGPPAAEVIKRGYEADGYDTKSVLSVPLLVVVFFVLAFATVTAMFAYFATPDHDPNTHPQAAERNAAPLNDRMSRIHRGGEIDQPRLEPLRLRDESGGDPRVITRPEKPVGNSPEIHPEDLRPSPEKTPALYRDKWTDAGKAFARISIDDAMALALKDKQVQEKLLPTAAQGTNPALSTNVPTAANAGRGAGASAAVPPKIGAPKKDEKEGKH